RQVESLRAARASNGEADGHIHFRLQALRPSTRGGIGDVLRSRLYPEPALTPAMPWLERASPAPPHARIEHSPNGAGLRARIAPVGGVPVRWWLVQVLTGERWESRL